MHAFNFGQITLQKLLNWWRGFGDLSRRNAGLFHDSSAATSNFGTFQGLKNQKMNFRTFQDLWQPRFISRITRISCGFRLEQCHSSTQGQRFWNKKVTITATSKKKLV